MKLPRFSAAGLQKLGRALMLPIAVLPIAGILLRLGQPELLDIGFVAAAGDAIFKNLGLLFAIGVAVGFARDGNGAAGLAGVVCFLVATNGAEALIAVPPDAVAGMADKARPLAEAAFRVGAIAKLSVPLGILSGVIGGQFYNRFGAIKLPEYLAFFGGRRFVPIVSGLAGIVLALIFGAGFSLLDHAIDALSYGVAAAGPAGLFAYGLLNRLLLVTGLHHILNNIVWFILGNFHGATGDLNRFFAGDPAAGSFMAGFFPVMIFGLPAACLAMYHAASPARRAGVGGLLLSLALTAMLTGVTEPIEFTFMFLAPALFVIHAVLTGVAMVVMDALGVKLGFGFSAGLLDYVLNFGKATRPLLLVPVGLVYAAVYYALFRWVIVRFDLKTPGRDTVDAAPMAAPIAGDRAAQMLAALGGQGNLVSIDACTTRLRLVVRDQATVDEAALRRLGARGVIRPSADALQVVVGPIADSLAREMREHVDAGPLLPMPKLVEPHAPVPRPSPEADALIAALGGATNIATVKAVSSRLVVVVRDDQRVDATTAALVARMLVLTRPLTWHVIAGPDAGSLAAQIEAALRP
ncbi:N-acetylglucosamine-specific PTS transporter subunit IIBC [Polymorphobacter sp. PAMC 29334]|uniref:N-acetylglucosamine-specific PTS transporter subunit IIBC n=1 Tax=Polymorphobacter sp. PAMC 29334 TaxID=2862331 RepID=UPI001C77F42C|nr:N-acetylglucosamine-specific PTS transporter subunit IIBC [Polymorphobacter sp. PAMC 29334]QYE33889.1 N-acetylglucosamine-specific PTS transporter subunit IIBC [Polymorphobacter sp. PAMC 29334]